MSCTWADVKTYSSRQKFVGRKNHNGRQKNLIQGKYAGQEFFNIVESFEVPSRRVEANEGLTKTELSKKISRLNARIKKAKAEETKERLTVERDSLIDLRANTGRKKKINTVSYIELTFSITDVEKHLKRNVIN